MDCNKQTRHGSVFRIIQTDVASENETEYLRWYFSEHEQLLLQVPGVISAYSGTKLKGDGNKYIYLYLLDTSGVFESEAYKKASQTQWALKIRPFLSEFQATNYDVLDANLKFTCSHWQGNIYLESIELEKAFGTNAHQAVHNVQAQTTNDLPIGNGYLLGRHFNGRRSKYLYFSFLDYNDLASIIENGPIFEKLSKCNMLSCAKPNSNFKHSKCFYQLSQGLLKT